MFGTRVQRREERDDLFDRIGAFLVAQGLGPDPVNYRFAHEVVTQPQSATARAVKRISEDGVRLTRQDVERLGCTVVAGAPVAPITPVAPVESFTPVERNSACDTQVEQLAAQTQSQVDDFAAMVRTIHAETQGFGRELAQSAVAIDRASRIAAIDEVARITDTMVARVRHAETRLARATEESDALRIKLAEAHTVARRDLLTGLPNRRAFEEAFATRDPTTGWCLVVGDIDRFKRVNDEHGHAVGDRVIRAVGAALATGCDGHLVARYGGEEFVMLLGVASLADAARLLDTTRRAIATKRFRDRETEQPLGRITLSAGVTPVAAGESVEAAFARADRLLYAAKTDGRDRVCAG